MNGLTTAANLSITIGFLRKPVNWNPLELALPAPNTPPCSILEICEWGVPFLWVNLWVQFLLSLAPGMEVDKEKAESG